MFANLTTRFSVTGATTIHIQECVSFNRLSTTFENVFEECGEEFQIIRHVDTNTQQHKHTITHTCKQAFRTKYPEFHFLFRFKSNFNFFFSTFVMLLCCCVAVLLCCCVVVLLCCCVVVLLCCCVAVLLCCCVVVLWINYMQM